MARLGKSLIVGVSFTILWLLIELLVSYFFGVAFSGISAVIICSTSTGVFCYWAGGSDERLSAVAIFALLGFAAALSRPALAAQVSDNPPTGQTEIIQISKAVALANSIAAVTGLHDEVVGQGASAHAVSMPYAISAETRWALTDDLGALNAVIEQAQKKQKATVDAAEKLNGGPLKPKTPAVLNANGVVITPAELSDAQIALNADLQKLADSEVSVAKLFHIKRGDLKLNDNPIPGMTLDAMRPIIDP
jgi:hypothetical protein